jgi:signal transduction histidine kinase
MINFDLKLLFIGLSILVSIIIAITVLINNKNSATNKTFFAFTLSTIIWGIVNYINSQINFNNEYISLFFLRLNLFLGLSQAFFLFRFFLVYPREEYSKRWWEIFLIYPLVFATAILIFTPYVFSKVISFTVDGHIKEVSNGPGIALFGMVAISLVFSGLFIIFKKYIKYSGEERTQARLVLNGSFLMFFLIIIFNFILPNAYNNSNYVAYSAVYVIPFLIFTTYSIVKYHLFSLKIIATELITFSLWIFILARALIADSLKEQVINGVLFVIVVVFGISLIKSVRSEVKQKERLEALRLKLEKSNIDLEVANEKLKSLDKLKTEFVSLASHQLRSPLTAIKGYASMLAEGDYGEVNQDAKGAIDRIFQSSKNLTIVVEDLLNVTKIEAGGMKYEMAPFDLYKISQDEAKDLSITAEKKGLKLSFDINDQGPFMVNGDKEKIRQIIINFIDNSIKYTKEGSINVSVKNINNKVVFCVKDTGVGMTEEIKESLFQKFVRGDGARLNTTGSGLGLYLAKEITEAHKGRVWVESEGVNKGSSFFMELDTIK